MHRVINSLNFNPTSLLPPLTLSPSSPSCFPHPDRTINRATTTAKPDPTVPPLPGREFAFAAKEPSWGDEYDGERTHLGPGRQTCRGAHTVSLGRGDEQRQGAHASKAGEKRSAGELIRLGRAGFPPVGPGRDALAH
ncbi:hypothetical protein Droror1_Dr00018726 [Drosera rotundifolia]